MMPKWYGLSAGGGRSSVAVRPINLWSEDVDVPGFFDLGDIIRSVVTDPDAASVKLRAKMAEVLERRSLGLTEGITFRLLDREVKTMERALLDVDMAEGRV